MHAASQPPAANSSRAGLTSLMAAVSSTAPANRIAACRKYSQNECFGCKCVALSIVAFITIASFADKLMYKQ